MNLHEYQSKQLFAQYGIPVPYGIIAHTLDEAEAACDKINSAKIVVKAQVHAGGRGKAGGVKIVSGKSELAKAIQGMLHQNLVTIQTDAVGQPVNIVLIEEPCEIDKELYLSAVIDRSKRRVVVMVSTEGGMDIEEVAKDYPEKILSVAIDPMLSVMPYQGRELGYALGLNGPQIKQFIDILTKLMKLFVEKDLSLVEVNPLVITKAGDLLCLDAKINVDENALYRQPEINAMWDPTQEDVREIKAKEWGLNYISLTGNIGCMVNGAGLAMATMDLIKLCGGSPANFLDVGGSATKERVTEAFKIILSDSKVNGVLVNIFGGIVKCDLIAQGIIDAVGEVGITIPVVVRLEGNRAKEGGELLSQSGLNIIAAKSWQDAAEQIVRAAGEK